MQQRLWKCLYHPNRFIRETGYEMCGDLCSIFAGAPLQGWGADLALKLQDGLSENWSQVSSTSILDLEHACSRCMTKLLLIEGMLQEWYDELLLQAQGRCHRVIISSSQDDQQCLSVMQMSQLTVW